MEQFKLFSKKTILKSSHSLDEIILKKDHIKKNKPKNSTITSSKESLSNKEEPPNDLQYNIIATSIVNDIDGLSNSDSDSDSEDEKDPNNQKKLDEKQNSEPNLNNNNSNKGIITDKKNIIENNQKKDEYITISPELNSNEIAIKSYITGNDSPNNISPKNVSFNTHYKNSSECSNNGKGFGGNGDNNRFMEDENNYKEDNNDTDKKKDKENQVNIEEISAEEFFEYLNYSNISKINENISNSNDKKDIIYNLLIFDFRVFCDFKNEYISKSINVNIPTLILNRSMKHHYTNSFNIQNFVSLDDKKEIQKWLMDNYKTTHNKSYKLNTKPLIILYDDQNIMDIDICCSPVKTVMKFLEVQHIIALNEVKYSLSLSNDQSSSSDNSQSISNQENELNDYLLDKELNIAWVTGGYDAICSHSESSHYIINNESKEIDIYKTENINNRIDDDYCATPLKTKPTIKIGINNRNDMECSTPVDTKPITFNNSVIKDNNYENNRPNLALNLLNKKNKPGKQKLSLNINCAINNCSDECKTPLSAIPNNKESNINSPQCSVQRSLSKKINNPNISMIQSEDDDLYPKNQRRKKSTLLISINKLEKKTDQPVPQIQPNGMLGVSNYSKNLYKANTSEGCEASNPHKILYNKSILQSNRFSPSSDLPLNISPTTSTIIPHYTKVLPYLYIGTETIPASEDAVIRLKKLKVTHVLNVAMECNVGVTFPEDQIVYKKIDLADNLAENIAKYLWESCEWIENERKKNSNAVFYIHCKAGKSRSATVVIAYLMKVEHWSLNKAYSYLKDLRPNISPNLGFMSALLEMEAEIKKQEELKADENKNSNLNINKNSNNATNVHST
ncbi:hypothetical protein BCR32DRAFT_217217 [Anaeromyces robustus]|uniref:protein-tyrosine-phosphatase n=1 Tax=Anaeromyces robustus TaxID=1754192 RepID=A0A1Y1XHN1_9FUNG|nr:hypothetical protein BCR32DRAFT_217217 [Anaeromyces robustus]|eukprot:ORX85261.1 hypothetical protein BCR32DRAFT_217217 [Anaeromyces robustus]